VRPRRAQNQEFLRNLLDGSVLAALIYGQMSSATLRAFKRMERANAIGHPPRGDPPDSETVDLINVVTPHSSAGVTGFNARYAPLLGTIFFAGLLAVVYFIFGL
jgi:hypothetical protein